MKLAPDGEPDSPALSAGFISPAARARHPVLLALSVVLVAVNLRPAVAGVGPVLPELRAGLPLSGAGAAVLTTLPVLCFGLLATVAPRLARRFGIEAVLVGVMAALAAGAFVRVLDGPALLFADDHRAGEQQRGPVEHAHEGARGQRHHDPDQHGLDAEPAGQSRRDRREQAEAQHGKRRQDRRAGAGERQSCPQLRQHRSDAGDRRPQIDRDEHHGQRQQHRRRPARVLRLGT